MASYDAIVVGGGVVGLSAAYHLVRGGARALLVDRGDAGRATDAGAGILSTLTDVDDPDPYHRFAARAAADYPRMIEDLGADGAEHTGYAVCGALTVAVDGDELAAFESARAHLPAGAGGHEEISAEAARSRFPALESVLGAIWSPRGARVDGRLLALSLEQAAIGRGLEMRRAEVSGMRLRGDRVRAVTVGSEEIPADHLVIAAGAWSSAFGPAFGVRIPIVPQRGQIAHLDLPGADTRTWPIVKSFGSDHYMVAWDDGRVVAGATRERNSGFEPRTTVAGIQEVLAEAVRVAPGLRHASLREVRVGLRPLSADGLPILGPIPKVTNVLLATGHGPVGLQLGPYSGKVIAGSITGETSDADFRMFGLERFL